LRSGSEAPRSDRFRPGGFAETEALHAFSIGVSFIVISLDSRPVVATNVPSALNQPAAILSPIPGSHGEPELNAARAAVVAFVMEALNLGAIDNASHRTYVRYNPSNPLPDRPRFQPGTAPKTKLVGERKPAATQALKAPSRGNIEESLSELTFFREILCRQSSSSVVRARGSGR
jgi:hypothetical protein